MDIITAISPAYGSGAARYGGFYSQTEIREIVRYAQTRHVTIVPEIDLPGHARAMIVSLPDQLVDHEDTSRYTSIQGYHDNVLSPCKEITFKVLEDIISEIADLFPGEYIHIGGDEVPTGVWEKSCAAKKYDVADPQFKQKVQNDFMMRVQNILNTKRKKMAGWEEIADETTLLSSPLRVYVWNEKKMAQVYKTSAQAGYKIIVGPAENLYFDMAYNSDPKEPGLDWAGFTDTFSAYSFAPVRFDEGQTEEVIQGVQGQLWSELLISQDRLDYMGFPKLAGLAELAWTPASERNRRNFHLRMSNKHLKRLDYYGVRYRKAEFSGTLQGL